MPVIVFDTAITVSYSYDTRLKLESDFYSLFFVLFYCVQISEILLVTLKVNRYIQSTNNSKTIRISNVKIALDSFVVD